MTTPIRFGSTPLLGQFIALCLLGLSFTASAQESHIITFDVPGAGNIASPSGLCSTNFFTACYGTTPMANNNAGEIVGMYITNDGVYYGFLRSPGGKVTKFSEPNADTTPGDFNGTYPISLNSWGAVTGLYQKTDEVFQGTFPGNINDNGEVAGFYIDSSNNFHGFIRSPQGEFTTVDDPNANAGTIIALEQGLNARGAVAGWYFVDSVLYGFVREPNGKFITVAPLASAPGTLVGGINSSGALTGYFVTPTFSASGYLQKPNGEATIFNVPGPEGALGTDAFTLNSRDEVTGVAVDANNATHGFVRYADGDIKIFDAANPGTGSFQGTRPTTINDSGQVVGWVLDSNNVAHGFIFRPR